jgi:hypothetical protein
LQLEPSRSLSEKVILARLEAEAVASKKASFGEFLQQHDILSGAKKVRVNDALRSRDEEKYLKKMRSLVAGAPAKLLNPRSFTPKRHARGPSVAEG